MRLSCHHLGYESSLTHRGSRKSAQKLSPPAFTDSSCTIVYTGRSYANSTKTDKSAPGSKIYVSSHLRISPKHQHKPAMAP